MKDFTNPHLYTNESTLFEDAKKRYRFPNELNKIIQENREYWKEQEDLKNRLTVDQIGERQQYRDEGFSNYNDMMANDKYDQLVRDWTFNPHADTNKNPITMSTLSTYLSQASQTLSAQKLDINKLSKEPIVRRLVLADGIMGAVTILASHFQMVGWIVGLPTLAGACVLAFLDYRNKQQKLKESLNHSDESTEDESENNNREDSDFRRPQSNENDMDSFDNLDKDLFDDDPFSESDIRNMNSEPDGMSDDEFAKILSNAKRRPKKNHQILESANDESPTFMDEHPDLINAHDVKGFYEYAEHFLRYIIDNRKELSKLKTPRELWNLYSKMLPAFNTGYAVNTTVERDSIEFYNIAYTLHKFFMQTNNGYARATQHDDSYPLMIDTITSNDLFYKIQIRVPIGSKPSDYTDKNSQLYDLIKASPNDNAIAVNFAVYGDLLTIKLFKIAIIQDGARSFSAIPLVSDGDIARFKGIKATNGRPLLDVLLDDKSSINTLLGLSEGENGVVMDIGVEKTVTLIGASGSGKSASSLSTLIMSFILHNPEDLLVFVLDPKNASAWGNARFFPQIQMLYASNDEIKKSFLLPAFIRAIGRKRQELIQKMGWEEISKARTDYRKKGDYDNLYKIPHILVVLDEQQAYYEALESLSKRIEGEDKLLPRNEKRDNDYFGKYAGGISESAVTIREAGITFWGISQNDSYNSEYPQSLLKATSMGISMKVGSQSTFNRVIKSGDSGGEDPKSFPTGYSYYESETLGHGQVTMPLIAGNSQLTRDMSRILGIAMSILANERMDLTDVHPYAFLDEAYDEFKADLVPYGVKDFPYNNRGKRLADMRDMLSGKMPLFANEEAEENRTLYWDMPISKSEEQNIRNAEHPNKIRTSIPDDKMAEYKRNINLIKRIAKNGITLDQAYDYFDDKKTVVQLVNQGYLQINKDHTKVRAK